jgi:hypothetical protein
VPEFALDVFDGFVQPVANAGVVIDRKDHVDTVVRRAEPGKGAMNDGHRAIPVPLDHRGGSIDLVRQVSPADLIDHIRDGLGQRIAGTNWKHRDIEQHVFLLIEIKCEVNYPVVAALEGGAWELTRGYPQCPFSPESGATREYRTLMPRFPARSEWISRHGLTLGDTSTSGDVHDRFDPIACR